MRYILASLLILVATSLLPAAPAAAAMTYYVSPSGSDGNTGSSDAPFRTIQHAVDLAQPGDVITLTPGVYMQDVVSRRSGTATAPITIKGPASAIVKGGGGVRVFQITHDYITLEGFTIDGLWADPATIFGYRDKLLYVIGSAPRDGVTGLKVLKLTLKNAGGECLRLRYFAQQNEVAGSTIANCGVYDFRFQGGGKNGEGIYIGTAPEQLADGKNPTAETDRSSANWIHHNRIDTQGGECVDLKEGTEGNLVEYNTCTGQKDPKSAGFGSRGNSNTLRFNESYGNVGAGIRLGGDTPADGINNNVYNNQLYQNEAGGIKVQRMPQGHVCGNTIRDNDGGDVIGTFDGRLDPTRPCPAGVAESTAGGRPAVATPAPAAAIPSAAGRSIAAVQSAAEAVAAVARQPAVAARPQVRPTSEPDTSDEAVAVAAPLTPTPPIDTNKYQVLTIAGVTASDDDGHAPGNTIDNSLATRWSAKGDGQRITFDLGTQASVSYVAIAFHEGDERTASFAIDVSADRSRWSRVFRGHSSGETLQPEAFRIGDIAARYIRIIGYGNTRNRWNSITEVDIYGNNQ